MPRRKRVVIAGYPHHITQRGVRRGNVFFDEEDRLKYLALLVENSKHYGVEIIAYCLMTNHVHHLLVPLEEDSLRWTLQFTHKRYADYLNGKNGWTGHAWQEKFYSSPVDDEYFWVTLRYIEQNPVAAGMVLFAEDYKWSSAKSHVSAKPDPVLTSSEKWQAKLSTINSWEEWLRGADSSEKIATLRKNTSRDLPTGSEAFLDFLEHKLGRSARPPKMGRPKKVVKS